jgi:hypothetical protein
MYKLTNDLLSRVNGLYANLPSQKASLLTTFAFLDIPEERSGGRDDPVP